MRALTACILAIVMASPAQAGWQWTEWGMSKEEALAASPLPIVEQKSTGTMWVLTTTHDAVGRTFSTELWGYETFDGLMMVQISSDELADCQALEKGLIEKHGRPAGTYLVWATADGNVLFNNQGDGCELIYSGIAPARTDGL